jgi:type II secretory ATPase GspE/PulE/Tfp pilus assembly ATPase PilB-like protein
MTTVLTKRFEANNTREEPVTKALNEIFDLAGTQGMSDIHLESEADHSVRARLRMNGRLFVHGRFPPEQARIVFDKIRYRANLSTQNTKVRQDGRIIQEIGGHVFDVRVSFLPTINESSCVMRLLDPRNSGKGIEDLGMTDVVRERYVQLLRLNEGVVLLTGPTGSGKTTTLYAGLNMLNEPHRKILTAEDPVEYTLPGAQQSQVGQGTGLTFAEALKSALRQDPDVILVGEIRDKETADIAMRAGLTGHVVLSTLHSNNAVDTIYRLLDLGVERHILKSALRGIVAQRLLRTVCPRCAERREITDPELFTLNGLEAPTYELVGAGCAHCHSTGYYGRLAIHEMVVINAAMRSAIPSDAPILEEQLKRAASGQPQYEPLLLAGLKQVVAGNCNTASIMEVISDVD